MGKIDKIKLVLISLLLLLFYYSALSQPINADSLEFNSIATKNSDTFYDSLQYKAKKSKFKSLFYKFLVTPPHSCVDKQALSLKYYSEAEGKIISSIDITPLDVFGPSFEDTTKKAKSWVEKTANSLHSKSNLKTIEKLLMFHVGDSVNAELMYENERIIRSLPYIKDLRIQFEQDSIYTNLVKVHVITKDRFSLGATGGVNGVSSADIELYNKNIFGVGHEISFRFVGHLKRQPYLGVETFYKINNIRGKFIDISAGYMNTYKKEGFSFILNKPFITPSVKWGYGANAVRMYRTDRILEDDPIRTVPPLDLSFLSAWGGRSFQIKPNTTHNSQMVLAAGFYNRTYFQRPIPSPENNQYFSNSTFYLAGITFTQRRYIQDQLVYSYGITEDIPEGFKNEFVYGFDANEFGDRQYAHIYFSNGNFLITRKGYLYMDAGIGGYFKGFYYEQGQIEASINFISRQVHAGRKRFRLFVRTNYTLGIRRFEIENLNFERNNYIRGFSSRIAEGKQRLNLNLEYVLFLRKEFYKFNIAIFGFSDIGIIGSNKQLIFAENYYSGIGMGIRIHNENLVFKTFHLRLAFYPFHPSDMGLVGFILGEQSKQQFYNFEPTAPLPMRFE